MAAAIVNIETVPEDGIICPGDSATVTVTTLPPDAFLDEASISVVGGGGSQSLSVIDENGDPIHEFAITAGSGKTVEFTAKLGTVPPMKATIKVKNNDFSINVDPIIISAEPKLPAIKATTVGIGGAVSQLALGDVTIDFVANDCPPHGPADLRTSLDTIPTITTVGEETTIDFGDTVRGGSFSLRGNATVNGCGSSTSGSAGIEGTNPNQSDIKTAIDDLLREPGAGDRVNELLSSDDRVSILLRIACIESGQRQFDAPPNGGVAFCPLFGPDGGVGIMGIRSPTADEVWNWRENVKKGIDRLNEKVLQAEEYPGQVRSSIEFQALVEAFNQKRISEGKPAIDVQLPPFDKEQLIRDAIRGYDGWDDAGQFGLGLHEYRVPTIQDGSLKVDETTGKVDWELVTTRSAGNLDYVDDVLSSSSSFAMVCELEPLPPLQRTPSPEEQLCELLESDSFSSDEIDGIVEQTITIPRTEIYNAFDRLGHLRCKKPISKTGNNPCRVGVNHQGKHSVPVRLEDQKTVTLAESHSEGTHSQIQGSVAAKVEGAIGIPLLAKAKGSLETKIKGSRAWTDTDTTSVVIEIRNTLATTETLEMEGHAEDGFEIALPYGLRVIVTTEGNVRVRRQWTHDAQAGICQLGDVEIILVDLTADVSVEADTQPANMELVESLRETCP